MKRALVASALVSVAIWAVAFLAGNSADSHFPHGSLNFAIGIDTDGDTLDDCNTNTSDTTCALHRGAPFELRFYLVDNGSVSYEGYDAVFAHTGVTARGTFDGVSDPGTWPNCQFFAINTYFPDLTAIVCASQTSSSYTGSMATVDFTCTASGTISILHGEGNTELVAGYNHGEEATVAESLTIDGCGVAPTGTPTATPTSTPTPTITDTPEPVTPTPATCCFTGVKPVAIPICEDMPWCWIPIGTPEATTAPSPTPLPMDTPTPGSAATPQLGDDAHAPTAAPRAPGDVDGDGEVTSSDAFLILAYGAGFIGASDARPGSAVAADVYKDGNIDSLDALLALQIEAGLLSS